MPGAAWEHPMMPREHPCVVMRVGEGRKVQDGRTAGGARSEAVWRKGQEGRLQDVGCGLGAGWRRAVVQCILSLCRCCVRSMACVLRPAILHLCMPGLPGLPASCVRSRLRPGEELRGQRPSGPRRSLFLALAALAVLPSRPPGSWLTVTPGPFRHCFSSYPVQPDVRAAAVWGVAQ